MHQLEVNGMVTVTYLRKVKLERVVGAQAYVQPGLEKVWEWVPLIREKQSVVTQRTHRETNLPQIEKVL